MAKRSPNKFTKATASTLARRAGDICSNPDCATNTSGPHSDERKAVSVGEAAHIRGAEPGSARYDPTMVPEERSNITNGIWLCRRCARLIDSDARKYTVELLYVWKRTHESSLAQKLGSSGWTKAMQDIILHQFANESPAAQQIVLDHPSHWEYLLTLELLRSRLSRVRRGFSDLERGLIYRPSKILGPEQFLVWFQEKLEDLTSLIHLLLTASTEDLVSGWGKPGEPGDAVEIRRACDKIADGCQGLLDWETDVRFTVFPNAYQVVKPKIQGWTEHFLVEMDRIPTEIVKILAQPDPRGRYVVDLVFRPPENIYEVRDDIIRIASRGVR